MPKVSDNSKQNNVIVDKAFSKIFSTRVSTVFWDFDGVIKDSVDVKTQAFIKLFQSFGEKLTERVREHHESNGGMSRFDKIPIYLSWAGKEPSKSTQDIFCNKFGELVLQSVIDAPWVSGVEDFLRSNPYQQSFVLVTATPQNEIETILHALGLRVCFSEVFGSPTRKSNAIQKVITSRGLNSKECLMIGDARADIEAAQSNNVAFLLRRHKTNAAVFADYSGPSVKDFTSL